MSFIGLMISIVIFTAVSTIRMMAKIAINEFNNYAERVAQNRQMNRYNNIATA